jgi:hypothetical protein
MIEARTRFQIETLSHRASLSELRAQSSELPALSMPAAHVPRARVLRQRQQLLLLLLLQLHLCMEYALAFSGGAGSCGVPPELARRRDAELQKIISKRKSQPTDFRFQIDDMVSRRK